MAERFPDLDPAALALRAGTTWPSFRFLRGECGAVGRAAHPHVLLSDADRSRFVSDETRAWLTGADLRAVRGAVLHDGMLVGAWRPEGAGLVVEHGVQLSKRTQASTAAESRRMLEFTTETKPAGEVRLSRSG
ncbi:MAG: DNA glycosylase AlkZ-like family protein [Acidimicrobiales bacterium]